MVFGVAVNSRGPYGQNRHFSASRYMAWILSWHESMIFWKPKSPLKNCFRPICRVLCTCAFSIWIFNKSKNNRANVLILHYLKEFNIPYVVWKNQPKRTKAAKVIAIQSFDDKRATTVQTLIDGWYSSDILNYNDLQRGEQQQWRAMPASVGYNPTIFIEFETMHTY